MTANRNPLVSVVMPVYNGERFLAEAIGSILAQTFTDFEFLIVDDGSRDRSAEIIRDYAKSDERVRLIQHARNQGSASARNSGIALARGEFIAAMDCDDISLPERLEKQVDFLLSHPGIGVVGVFLQTVNEDLTRFRYHEYPQQHALIILLWILGRTTLAGPAIMARRKVLLSVGAYEDARRVTADKELFSRLYVKTRFANLPETLYLYRHHDNQKSVRLQREQRKEFHAIRRRWQNRLVGEEQPIPADRFKPLAEGQKLGWRERRLLRGDIERLINALYDAGILVDKDLPLLEAEVRSRLESTMPRRWQMFCHWRRHHFGPA